MATSSRPPLSPLNPHHLFTPIEEGNEDEELSQGKSSFRGTSPNENSIDKRLHLTPTYQNSPLGKSKRSCNKRQENGPGDDDDDVGRGILCNKCRPSGKDKISVVPMETSSLTSPNGILKSFFSSLVKKSPKSCSDHDHELQSSTASTTEEQWKMTATELSDKLVQTTRNKDEAVLEASRLKYSMSELEKKLNNLEIYCQSLKSGLELCSNNKPRLQYMDYNFAKVRHQTKTIEYFTVAVSEARSSIRVMSRALLIHLKKRSGIVHEDRLALLLQPYDIKITAILSRNPKELLVFMEALLNKAFYEDFETTGFQKSAPTRILNPIDRCEANFESFKKLQELTWGEVLTKGTRHFSEDYSKFCDRKMSEIVSTLCWNRAWPEQLLQSFFIASKAIWSVHLLSHSLHPSLPIFRVDKGSKFDSIYMEDMGGDKTRKLILVPTNVIVMVTPGFFVFDNVVKCKVICRYHNNNGSHGHVHVHVHGHGHGHVLTPSPTYLGSLSSNSYI